MLFVSRTDGLSVIQSWLPYQMLNWQSFKMNINKFRVGLSELEIQHCAIDIYIYTCISIRYTHVYMHITWIFDLISYTFGKQWGGALKIVR